MNRIFELRSLVSLWVTHKSNQVITKITVNVRMKIKRRYRTSSLDFIWRLFGMLLPFISCTTYFYYVYFIQRIKEVSNTSFPVPATFFVFRCKMLKVNYWWSIGFVKLDNERALKPKIEIWEMLLCFTEISKNVQCITLTEFISVTFQEFSIWISIVDRSQKQLHENDAVNFEPLIFRLK